MTNKELTEPPCLCKERKQINPGDFLILIKRKKEILWINKAYSNVVLYSTLAYEFQNDA